VTALRTAPVAGFERGPVTALAVAAAAWCSLLLAAPTAHGAHAWSTVVYEAAGRICHQQMARSFDWAGTPFPVCGRCLALYLSGAAALIVAAAAAWAAPRWLDWPGRALWRRRGWTPEATWLAAATLPSALLLIVERFVFDPGTGARALLALPLGGTVGWICGRSLTRLRGA
jgi:hypothetical protein